MTFKPWWKIVKFVFRRYQLEIAKYKFVERSVDMVKELEKVRGKWSVDFQNQKPAEIIRNKFLLYSKEDLKIWHDRLDNFMRMSDEEFAKEVFKEECKV